MAAERLDLEVDGIVGIVGALLLGRVSHHASSPGNQTRTSIPRATSDAWAAFVCSRNTGRQAQSN